jgi:RimJ/RimL family protein N-acetyltransferase
MKSPFGAHVDVPVVRYATCEVYRLMSIDDRMAESEADIRRVVVICNEPLVYSLLFRDRMGGRPYAEEDARDFFRWAKDGWVSGDHLFFLVRDPAGEIAACIDIGGLDDSRAAAIGCWASSVHRGLMTNVVKSLAVMAGRVGYRRLVAFIEPRNVRSTAVVSRVGFVPAGVERLPLTFLDRPLGKTLEFRRWEYAL